MRRAVLMDPHPLWLDAVEGVLRRASIEAVARCSSSAEAVELVREHQPELLITELNPLDVRDYVEQAVTASPATTIIGLTANEDKNFIGVALRAGVSAYVVKTAMPDVFEAVVRPTFASSVFLPTSIEAVPSGGTENAKVPLTRREAEILQRVARGASNSEVGQSLWVTEQTVKFHLSNIYKKLGVANRTEAAMWAEQNGQLGEPSAAA
jgi:DNA-binding NarL/FixJ family response regulator